MSADYQSIVQEKFPGAFEGPELTRNVNKVLKERGLTPENTLFAYSTCPDEVNRLVTRFGQAWETHFPLGGLSGFPFVGKEGFGALSHHPPEGGSLFVMYASHVGIDAQGNLGAVLRRGQTKATTCCGSAMAAYEALKANPDLDTSTAGAQQSYVLRVMKNNWEKISKAQDPILEISNTLYDKIHEDVREIIPQSLDMNIVLLGGIQINTPYSSSTDYFLVKEFRMINPKREENVELLTQL